MLQASVLTEAVLIGDGKISHGDLLLLLYLEMASLFWQGCPCCDMYFQLNAATAAETSQHLPKLAEKLFSLEKYVTHSPITSEAILLLKWPKHGKQ
jgi:hypothetical protein